MAAEQEDNPEGRFKPLALFARQPIPGTHSMLFRSFHPADPSGQIRTQQPGSCRFLCQPPNCCESEVDRRCSIALLSQIDAIANDDGLIESEPRFRTVPVNEVANGVVVRALRAWDVRLLRTADPDCSRSGSRRTVLKLRLRFRFGHAGIFCRTCSSAASEPEALL
jgi:hypothetical protein